MLPKGYTHSLETKRKIGIANTGKKRSEEIKRKLSILKKGKKFTEEQRRNMGARKGRIVSKETRKRIGDANRGKVRSKEIRKQMSEREKGRIPWNKGMRGKYPKEYSDKIAGSKNRNWKGGVTPLYKKIRESPEYQLWRIAVFARDNWTCQKTNIKGGKLHPHHIKNFAQYPELRFAIDNGITLSKKSHEEFHKRYGKKSNNKEQLEKFLRIML